MATNAGTIVVDLQARVNDFKKNIKSAQTSVAGFRKNLNNFVKSNGLVLAAAGAAVAAAVAKVTLAASDLEETQAKFNTVFRGSEEAAERFASVLQESYATSETEAKKFLASIQDTLVPMGIARDKATDLSGEIVKLAADLGSFNNLPTEQVVRDLQSALVGNTETVKKYGVVLKAADIQQVALLQSGKKNISQLTQAERVTAAYKIILEGTEDAQGDMIRTGDSFANRLKKLQARFTDLSATVGQFTIGPGSDLLSFLTKHIEKLNESVRVIGETTGSWKEFGITMIMSYIEVLATAIMSTVRFIETFSGIGPLLKLVGVDMEAFNRKIDENIVKMKESAQANLNNINNRIASERKRAEQETEIKNKEAEATKKSLLELAQAKVEADKFEKKMLEENEKAADKFTEEQQKNAFKRESELKRAKERDQAVHRKTLENIASQSENFMTNLFSNHLSTREKRQAIFRQVMGNLQRLVTQQFIRSQVIQRSSAVRTSAIEAGAAKAPIAAKFFSAHAALPFVGQAIALGFIAAAFSFIDRVAKFQTGGIVPGAGNQDTVPALLTPGERVLTKKQNRNFESGGMGSPINVTFNVSGQFIDGSESKWQDLIRTRLLPEIKRITQSRPNSPFNRVRGAP